MFHFIKTMDNGFTLCEDHTLGEAVKRFCTECMGWGEEHPKDCTAPTCPLFPYRGKSCKGYHKDVFESEDDMIRSYKNSADAFIGTAIKSINRGSKVSSTKITYMHTLFTDGRFFDIVTPDGTRTYMDKGELRDAIVVILIGMKRGV
jgi:hypothetical protein